jgi:hypothetical protein
LGGVPPVDRHDGIFLREGRCITPIRTFIELCTLGEGPQGHEAPRHAIVHELVPDRVCVVWPGFLEDPLEVVCGRLRLMLVAVCDSRDAPHIRATHLPVIAIIMVGCGHSPLKALLVPPFATLDALPTAVDGDVGWRSLTAAQGRLPASLSQAKHDHLVAGGMLDGYAVLRLECVPNKVGLLAGELASLWHCLLLGDGPLSMGLHLLPP